MPHGVGGRLFSYALWKKEGASTIEDTWGVPALDGAWGVLPSQPAASRLLSPSWRLVLALNPVSRTLGSCKLGSCFLT